jgi:hypothetical protein
MIVTRRTSGVPCRIETLENTDTWRIAATKATPAAFTESRSTYFASGFLTSTITASTFEKSTNGSSWICL